MDQVPLVAPGGPLSEHDRVRFARHLSLSEVGELGQRRIAAASVLLVGAGGLASGALPALIAAGIGRLTVVDDDIVELTNLQRQSIHRMADLQAPKVDSALRLAQDAGRPDSVRVVRTRVDADSVLPLVAEHDVVIDATDNFEVRFALGDACAVLAIPLVWAAIQRFEAQLTVWSPPDGPCLRCVFPTPPPPDAVPSCAMAGVLGVLPATVGALQATEVLKLILGIGQPLVGRMLLYDALAPAWQTLPLAASPDCPVCQGGRFQSGEPTTPTTPTSTVPTVSPREAARLVAGGAARLLDVRTDAERDEDAVRPSDHLVLDQLLTMGQAELATLSGEPELLVYCAAGARSATAVRHLGAHGVPARSVDGGLTAWRREVGPDPIGAKPSA